jgi:hypothetical protein
MSLRLLLQSSFDLDPSAPIWIGGGVIVMFTLYVGIALLAALFGPPGCADRAERILYKLLNLFRLLITIFFGKSK